MAFCVSLGHIRMLPPFILAGNDSHPVAQVHRCLSHADHSPQPEPRVARGDRAMDWVQHIVARLLGFLLAPLLTPTASTRRHSGWLQPQHFYPHRRSWPSTKKSGTKCIQGDTPSHAWERPCYGGALAWSAWS